MAPLPASFGACQCLSCFGEFQPGVGKCARSLDRFLGLWVGEDQCVCCVICPCNLRRLLFIPSFLKWFDHDCQFYECEHPNLPLGSTQRLCLRDSRHPWRDGREDFRRRKFDQVFGQEQGQVVRMWNGTLWRDSVAMIDLWVAAINRTCCWGLLI